MNDSEQPVQTGNLLHRELMSPDSGEGAHRNGKRLDQAEGSSKPMHSKTGDPQPRGARAARPGRHRLNIHQACRRPEWRESNYAVFQTGPSATADTRAC